MGGGGGVDNELAAAQKFRQTFRIFRIDAVDRNAVCLPCAEVLATIGLTYDDAPIIAKVGVEEAIRTAVEAIKILDKQDRK